MAIMKKIPLNSLIFLIDVDSDRVVDLFGEDELLSIDRMANIVVGDSARPDLRSTFQSELERLIFLKLSVGQRVVVDVPDLRKETRVQLAKEATNKGFIVFYLVDDLNIRRDLISGDRIAEVVDLRAKFTVVKPLPDKDFFHTIKERGFNGITVVGDVHGMMNPLRNAISWARSRNNFLLFLGDLIDYGIDSLPVVEEVYQLVIRGEAEALEGNHERKIYRHLNQIERYGISRVNLSKGNLITTNRIAELNKFDHDRWVSRFNSLVSMMRNHRVSGDFIFAHGAVSSEMWGNTDHRLPLKLAERTLYGEVISDRKNIPGSLPNRVYGWVDSLKVNQIAVVGHDIRSNFEPLKHQGINGGMAVFLDTGCGKGGHLSTLDIRFDGTVAKIENFNIH